MNLDRFEWVVFVGGPFSGEHHFTDAPDSPFLPDGRYFEDGTADHDGVPVKRYAWKVEA